MSAKLEKIEPKNINTQIRCQINKVQQGELKVLPNLPDEILHGRLACVSLMVTTISNKRRGQLK